MQGHICGYPFPVFEEIDICSNQIKMTYLILYCRLLTSTSNCFKTFGSWRKQVKIFSFSSMLATKWHSPHNLYPVSFCPKIFFSILRRTEVSNNHLGQAEIIMSFAHLASGLRKILVTYVHVLASQFYSFMQVEYFMHFPSETLPPMIVPTSQGK